MKTWEIIFAVLLAAGGAVGWNSVQKDLSGRRDEGAASAVERTKDLARARAEHDRLEKLATETGADMKYQAQPEETVAAASARSGRAGAAAAVSPAARADAMSHIAELIQKGVLRSGAIANPNGQGTVQPAFSLGSDGKLAPGFGPLFNLRPDQVTHLQEVVDSIKEQAELVMVNRTSVRQNSENSYTLELQSSADDAARLRDQFSSEFQSVLGEDGYRQFTRLNGERVADNGTTVGGPAGTITQILGESRSITITRNANNFQFTTTVGEGRGTGGGTVPNLEVISSRFPAITKMLPPSFTTPFAPGRGAAGGGGGGDVRTVVPVSMEGAPRGGGRGGF